MTCPQCKERVPVKALWTATGLSGVVCPHCHASLCPKAIRAIVLFAVSFGLGDLTVVVLRRHGAELWLALLGFCLVFAGVHGVAAPLVLRLRLKDDTAPHFAGRRA